MKEALTAKQVFHMKPDPTKRMEVAAGPPVGLYLVVHPTGRKSWAYRYRWLGKPRKLTFEDPYPDMKLAAARAEAHAAKKDLEDGIDPTEKRKQEEEEQSEPDGFESVAKDFVNRYAMPKLRTWREVERVLNREAVPRWKRRLISDISRADVLRLLDAIMDRGSPYQANRTRAALSRLFNWSVERGLIESSPVSGTRRPASEKSRDRVLTAEELTDIWQASVKLDYPYGPYFQMLILTGQRRSEVSSMRWRDLNLDGALWTLPAAATKAARIHDVPLSELALEVLAAPPKFDEGDFVFTAKSGKRPIAVTSHVKDRLDKELLKLRQERQEAAGEDSAIVTGLVNWRIHDIRRTVATELAKLAVPVHVLAALLNHSPGQTMGISAVYIRHRYLEERRAALEKWGDYVADLVRVDGKGTNAVPV